MAIKTPATKIVEVWKKHFTEKAPGLDLFGYKRQTGLTWVIFNEWVVKIPWSEKVERSNWSFLCKGDFAFKRNKQYQFLNTSFYTSDSQWKSILLQTKRFWYTFSMPLGNINWDEVFLFANQLSCRKPCHSQGSAECRTCHNSSPACSTTVEDASKINSTFCCLWSYWLPPVAQLSHHCPVHGISWINSELHQNLLSKNNVVSVEEGAGQDDSFSGRTLSVV